MSCFWPVDSVDPRSRTSSSNPLDRPRTKSREIYVFSSLGHVLVLNTLGAQANVAADRSGKQERILQYDAEAAAQVGEIHFPDIDAVDAYRAFLHIIETQQQRNESRLAGTGVADDGHGFSGLDGEGHIAQNPVGSWRIATFWRRNRRALIGFPHDVPCPVRLTCFPPVHLCRRTRRGRTRCGPGLPAFL